MTYNLEEFKEWLEEEPSRKGNVDWNEEWYRIKEDTALEKLIKKEDYGSAAFNSSPYWNPYREIALKWKDLKDQERERERERESKVRSPMKILW